MGISGYGCGIWNAAGSKIVSGMDEMVLQMPAKQHKVTEKCSKDR